jgi:hypothetical protein
MSGLKIALGAAAIAAAATLGVGVLNNWDKLFGGPRAVDRLATAPQSPIPTVAPSVQTGNQSAKTIQNAATINNNAPAVAPKNGPGIANEDLILAEPVMVGISKMRRLWPAETEEDQEASYAIVQCRLSSAAIVQNCQSISASSDRFGRVAARVAEGARAAPIDRNGLPVSGRVAVLQFRFEGSWEDVGLDWTGTEWDESRASHAKLHQR